jgi:8-oxo-dGTP diphosphatase
LLTRNEPGQNEFNWSLPEFFLSQGENLKTAAEREIFRLTGTRDIYLEQLEAVSKIIDTSGEQKLAVLFFGLVKIEQPAWTLVSKQNGSWQKLENHSPLTADQQQYIEKALTHLRYKAALHPIGFELLPDLFTLPQMQKLYEAIYNTEFDRRNFSKKILSTGLLIDTGLRAKVSATNKAKFYKVDAEKYKQELHFVWNFLPEAVKKLRATVVEV